MHRKHSIAALVYNYLFPNPRPEDPINFSAHLNKNLVGEVRIETATFYGSLDTIEARYPGLNYSYAPHRKRLGRFPHHARLFKAFDDLGLTQSEIASFCRWEGTLWARERYEREEGIKVRDTTGMEIGAWIDRRKPKPLQTEGIKVKTDIEVEIEELRPTSTIHAEAMEEEDESDDDMEESVGFELNQRLIQAAAMREQGVNTIMDSEWEQFLKEAQEREALSAQNSDSSRPTQAHPAVNHPSPNQMRRDIPPPASNVH